MYVSDLHDSSVQKPLKVYSVTCACESHERWLLFLLSIKTHNTTHCFCCIPAYLYGDGFYFDSFFMIATNKHVSPLKLGIQIKSTEESNITDQATR